MKIMWRWMKKTLSFLSVLLIVILAVFVIAVKASGGEPTVFNHQIKTVLSGSMEPAFQTGSIIAIELTKDAREYSKGDVITFKDKNKNLVTHRVVEAKRVKQEAVYKTKGDNNDGPDLDPVLSKNVVGEYTGFTIPYAGYVLNYASSKTGSALLMFVPGMLVFLYAVISIRHSIIEFKNEQETAPPNQ
ncbi:signal peptidase I [Halobacillus salinarum]|uniref:Signal peptidase I n=1 Tax=Halobacillus salinarum TaxID=2932257 RepID=A0ABY4EIH3_9BACI|nr:signal peptidase I [Halobacillus salinarum]UOQ44257.1 signal peptidase I [Halobacillus salinarum]